MPAFNLTSQLSLIEFLLMSSSILLIALAGNIINDIFDLKTDQIKQRDRPITKQQISIKKAKTVYFVSNILALIIAIYLSIIISHWYLIVVESSVVLLLYLYSKYLKSVPVVGNILVSILVSLSFLIVLFFDSNLNYIQHYDAFLWVVGYGVFAFWANLNREWIKDIIDIKGDYAQNIMTLPILLGKSRMNSIIFISTVALIISLLVGVKVYFQPSLNIMLYLIFGICVPLVLVLFFISRKGTSVNYNTLSHIYKLTFLLGICSLALFNL